MTRREWLAGAPLLLRAQAAPRPNIVFILADDLGWTGVRCFGGRHAHTPHLDRLAAQGIRFSNAYVTPQCTPTRASLLTGQHTARNRMWHVIPRYSFPHARLREPEYRENLPRGAATLPAALRGAGYRTGMAGKWHLTVNEDGRYEQLLPEAAHHYGFDWAAPRHEPSGLHHRGDKGVDWLTDQAIGFIERERRGPFFLYLAHHSVHNPVMAPPPLVTRYRQRGYPEEGIHPAKYLAALEHLDASVGRLLAKLDEFGLRDNTLVVFLSDNGGVDALFDNAPLRAGKGSPYEGGIRVPCIVRWSGMANPGHLTDAPIHVVDWYPTLLELAGAHAPAGHTVDGTSFASLLRGGPFIGTRQMFWYMPLYDPQWGATPCAVLRDGDYKLIEFFGDTIDPDKDFEYSVGGRAEMYNLRLDLGERNNLAPSSPLRTEAMRRRIRRWLASLEAPLPTDNPDYDPARPLQR